ncbi:DUF2059 domain-containing protein [Lentibacter algarum]|uniref:DUF2059 domain-containing protein n=1 Tax=Lentibacter algarum TaxID=576131 RepID=UPI001C0A1644|nr:DUF2059 domain-containing protein [Lentibacter algarum]MBU2982408.1 DUF2059 domain-containing protein [Lentibacter algarum]
MRVIAVWVFAVFAALSGAVQADDDQGANTDAIKAFLTVTGFDVALESLRLGAQDAPQMLGLEASDFGLQWTQTADRVFDAKQIEADALSFLAAAMDDEMLAHAAGFYATELGQRLVAVENAAHSSVDTSGEAPRGEAIVAELEQSGGKRLDILKRMNHAIDPSNTGSRASQEVQIRFLLAASDAEVIDRLDEATLRALMAEQAEDMADELEQAALVSAATVYEPFDDDELEIYALALEHPVMQKVYELMNGIQYAIMADRYEQLALKMAGIKPAQEL